MTNLEIIVMSAFAALVLLAAFFAFRQARNEKTAVQRYAALKGWTYFGSDHPSLPGVLREMYPDTRYDLFNVVQIAWPPQSMFFFQYRQRLRARSTSNGFGCIAEPTARFVEPPVQISPRVPVLEELVGDKVEVGSEEFRKHFTVTCDQRGMAHTVLNENVQTILLKHYAQADYYLNIEITGNRVKVSSFWARNQTEWERLINLTGNLRDAIQ